MTGYARIAVLAALGLLAGRAALAQAKPTVAITGVVRDRSGRPAPGYPE